MLDLNCATIQGTGGLLERLAAITDPRAKRGVRHRLVSLLAIAAAAALSGAKSFVAVGEFAGELSQEALARLGARRHPVTGRYVAPHEATLRRAIRSVDPDQLDRALGGWLAEQTHPASGNSGDQQLPAVAVDGKTLRGARGANGRQVQLFAAMLHGQGTVLAQREVDPTTNEITQFRPLLDDLDLRGTVVTADALHTQADHARYLIQDKHADYLFTVKANQPSLEATIDRLGPEAFSPCAHRDCPWAWAHRAPNDPGERPTPRGHLSARRPAARHRPVRVRPGWQLPLGRGRLSRHQSHSRAGRSRPAAGTGPRPVGDREPAALGPRRDLRRGPLPGPHRPRAPRDGNASQPGDQRAAACGCDQHCCRAALGRPQPDPRAGAARPLTPDLPPCSAPRPDGLVRLHHDVS